MATVMTLIPLILYFKYAYDVTVCKLELSKNEIIIIIQAPYHSLAVHLSGAPTTALRLQIPSLFHIFMLAVLWMAGNPKQVSWTGGVGKSPKVNLTFQIQTYKYASWTGQTPDSPRTPLDMKWSGLSRILDWESPQMVNQKDVWCLVLFSQQSPSRLLICLDLKNNMQKNLSQNHLKDTQIHVLLKHIFFNPWNLKCNNSNKSMSILLYYLCLHLNICRSR